MPRMGGSTCKRAVALAVLVLVLLGALFHGPRLNRPFGAADTNAGLYFGLFVKTWQDFGFWELRGTPLGPSRLLRPDVAGIPYLNHPPGLSWLYALVGPEEWRMRLPTVFAAIGAAIALLLLLRRALGAWPAFGAAVCLLGLPSMTLYSQVSYETMVLGHGLWLWLATLRALETTGRTRAAWIAVQVAVSFTGPWADWSYGFFCVGLVPLVATRSLHETVARLWRPAVVTGVSAALIVAWRAWAAGCPLINAPKVDTSLGEMLRTTILDRPPLGEYLELAGTMLVRVTTAPLAVASVVGIAVLARRSPRLALGLLIAGLSQPLVFSGHATDHVHFYCYTGALLAAAGGALATFRGSALRIVGAVALAGLCAFAWITSYRVTAHSDTTFYRDLGRVLTEATHNPGPDGEPRKDYRVGCNFPNPYPYYIETPHVLAGDLTKLLHSSELVLQGLRGLRSHPHFPYGYRYLWFKEATGAKAPVFFGSIKKGLESYLGPLPRRRVPELEQRLSEPGLGLDLDIQEVWLVDVAPLFHIAVAHGGEEHDLVSGVAKQLEGGQLAIPYQQARGVSLADLQANPAQLGQLTHLAVVWTEALDGPGELAAITAAVGVLQAKKHLVVIAHQSGAGPAAAGPALAEGDYLAWIDVADLPPDALAGAIVRAYEHLAEKEDR